MGSGQGGDNSLHQGLACSGPAGKRGREGECRGVAGIEGVKEEL